MPLNTQETCNAWSTTINLIDKTNGSKADLGRASARHGEGMLIGRRDCHVVIQSGSSI